MPIRINLLAEDQAVEEQRRRDPVKRAIWTGLVLVSLMLAWASSLQLKSMMARRELGRLENQIGSHTNAYQIVMANKKKLGDTRHRLDGLQELAADRFLNGTVLNAMQKNTFDDVQLLRFKAEEAYVLNEEIKPHTNAADKFVPGKAATVTEKVVVTMDVKDIGNPPGDMVNKYTDSVAEAEYFRKVITNKSNVKLLSFSPAQTGTDGKPYVIFTLECRYPELTR
jgi:hypothetical protein